VKYNCAGKYFFQWNFVMAEDLTAQEMMEHTVDLASAFFANNKMGADELPAVLKKVFSAVVEVAREANSARNKSSLTPFVPIDESIHEDYIVCLEDGKKLQMLKRHLTTVYSMSVDQYREKWGLPPDYPVVAPSYARRRSEIAKTTGLGSSGRKKRSA
jgi:predicted transcriptional regulator